VSQTEVQPTILAGKYRLEEVIGTGGMGTIYRGTHVVLQRPVAVKILHLAGGGADLAERFLREAQVAAAIRHPNVVDIIDFGTTPDGRPFMVMEYLDGESLWDRMLRKAPLTTLEQVEVMGQVLLGLDAVHRAGILHRDLKPANLFLSPHDDGTLYARLLDFGISYSVDPESKLRRGRFGTDDRMIIGTPQYLSPEQAEGRPDLDGRADVWAIGVILYELLTGGLLPYDDENPGAVLFKVMSGGHIPLSQYRPDIPEIVEVVEAALAHDRERRPATARDFRRRLLGAAGVAGDLSGSYARLRLSSPGLRVTPAERDTAQRMRASRPTEPEIASIEPHPTRSRAPFIAAAGLLAFGATTMGAIAYWGTRTEPLPGTSPADPSASAATAHTGPLAPAPPHLLAVEPSSERGLPETAPETGPEPPPDRAPVPTDVRARVPTSAVTIVEGEPEEAIEPTVPETPRTGIVRDLDF
jgi:serine/threonine-protein kinase